MILSKEYDAALWYMIKGSRKSRKTIINFFNELPPQLVENIRKEIQRYNEHPEQFQIMNSEEDIDYDFYTIPSPEDPKYRYYFDIDDEGCLTISKSKDAPEEGFMEEEEFEIMIYPMRKEYTQNMDHYDDEWIGTVSDNYKTKHVSQHMQHIDCDEIEFNLYRTPLCHFVQHYTTILNCRFEIPVYIPINNNKVPDEISFSKRTMRRLPKK